MGGLLSKITGGIDLTKYYPLERIVLGMKAHGADKNGGFTLNCGDIAVPVRTYYTSSSKKMTVFIHGGGWVTESAAAYDKVCRTLMQSIGSSVISIDYSLAPEHKFPTALNECYAAVRETITHSDIFGISPEDVMLCGDSAGGNLCAAVSLLARDRGEFSVSQQILIYPVTACDYSPESPYASVHEKASGYSLTTRHMHDYTEMYARGNADRESPYFAPMKAGSFEGLPETLVITAENDPLRDEGEAFAKRISDAGGNSSYSRIAGAEHGFFMDMIQPYFDRAMELICGFAGR